MNVRPQRVPPQTFRQRTRWNLGITKAIAWSIGLTTTSLVHAMPAVVATQEIDGQVNVRSAPTTMSEILHTGELGDRLEILEDLMGTDGWTWYRVRFVESNLEGWIREDLVRLLSDSTAIQPGTYWAGPFGMGLRIEGDRYQIYDEMGPTEWRSITELSAVTEGVVFDGQQFWCLSTLPNAQGSWCSADGWQRLP